MPAQRKQDYGSSENYISQLWFKYIPYWPLFLIFSAISIAAAWYYLQNQVPMYSAHASIMMKDQANTEKGVEELKPIESEDPLESELMVLRAFNNVVDVVKNLGLYAPVFEERRFADRTAYQTSPVSILSRDADSIREVEKIYFTLNSKDSTISINNKVYPLNSWVNTPYGDLKFVANKNFSRPANHPLYFNLVHPTSIAGVFADRLNAVTANKSSSIVNMSILDEDSKRGADILNTLFQVYLLNSLRDKNEFAQNTLKFVESRLDSVKREVDSIQRKMQAIKSSGAIDISTQGSMYLQNVNQGDQKLQDVNTQLDVLNTLENYVTSKTSEGGIVPSSLGVNDAQLSALLSKLYDLELQYESKKKTTAENHPAMLSIVDQINKIKPSILESIRNQRQALQATRSNVASNTSKYNSKLAGIPQKERELLDISRQQSIKNNVYSMLLQKKEEAAISAASFLSENKMLVSAGGSSIPVSPNEKRTYAIAIILAFALCIGLIIGKEMFSRKILYRAEIEGATAIPVIAEIAYGKSKNLLLNDSLSKQEAVMADHFRKLRTSLTFLGIGTKRKKIVVTSSIPGEGKSFIVANLGYTLALAGKKVVLVELDLVNPKLSKKLFMNEEKGLTSYLTGEFSADEIIQQTQVQENLFMVPAGPLPDNPSELILSSKVPELLDYLNERFDCIIIDTAPVGPMTDAYIISSYCDATLYVVRHKHTPKLFIQRIDEENKINPLKNAAIVFNAVKNRGFGSGYGYGYSYGYGYNYSYKYSANGKQSKSKKKLVG